MYRVEIGEEGLSDGMEVEGLGADAGDECGVGYFDRAKGLEVVILSARNPFTDFKKVLGCMDTRNDGGAEFIGNAARHQKLDRLLKTLNGDFDAGCEVIFLWTVLDVHRPIIHETGRKYRFYLVGKNAIGIELDEKSQVFDTSNEVDEVGMKGGLTARDDDTIKQPLASFKKIKKFIFVIDCEKFRATARDGAYELGIVTVRATQCTPRRKHDSGELIGIIDESERFKAGDAHRIDKRGLWVYSGESYQ